MTNINEVGLVLRAHKHYKLYNIFSRDSGDLVAFNVYTEPWNANLIYIPAK